MMVDGLAMCDDDDFKFQRFYMRYPEGCYIGQHLEAPSQHFKAQNAPTNVYMYIADSAKTIGSAMFIVHVMKGQQMTK